MFGRFAIVSWGFVVLLSVQLSVNAQNPSDKVASEDLLPASTQAWFSVPDVALLDQQFEKTQFGQLTKDEALKPFIDSIRNQFRDWLNEKNVRLGIRIEDVQGVRSGEICLAGILPQQVDDGVIGRIQFDQRRRGPGCKIIHREPSVAISRRMFFKTLPLAFIGSSSRKRTERGTL